MAIQFAILNNLNASSIFILGLVGLLLFGKDLPLIARKLATEYFRYRKMIHEATADIQREMETAANHLEDEKRRFEAEVNATVPALTDAMNPETKPWRNSSSSPGLPDKADPYNALSGSIQKPTADALSLDVPAPSSLAHRSTLPAKTAAAQLAALDSYQHGVPAPCKIPPPL